MHEQSSRINSNRVAARRETYATERSRRASKSPERLNEMVAARKGMWMSSKPERIANTTSTQGRTGEVSVQAVFDEQKAHFATDVTKT
jgi:hypothetical protein